MSQRWRTTSSRRASSPRRCGLRCVQGRASRARSASRRARSSPRSRATHASPAGSSSFRRDGRRRSSLRSPCAGCPASAPRPRSGCEAPRSRRSATSLRSRTTICAACSLAASARCSATAPAASTRASSSSTRSGSRSASRTRSSATSPTASGSTTSCAGWPPRSRRALQRSGQVARTVTTKLRYADFSIRSRSTSLGDRHRRARHDRRPRLPPARPRPARPAGRAAPRRRRRLRPRRLPPALARSGLSSSLPHGCSACSRSRNSIRRILPVRVFGRSSTNSIRRGYAYWDRRVRTKSEISRASSSLGS